MKKIFLLILVSSSILADNYFNPLATIETKNLILRNCQESDAKDLFEVHGDPEGAAKYTPMELDCNKERTLYWIKWRLDRQSKNLPAPWAIEHKESKKVIGLCGFYTFDEINQCASLLFTSNRNNSDELIKEAINGTLEAGFEMMHLNRINIYIHPQHADAIKICNQLKHVGLKQTGVIPDCLYYKGTFHDRILYCITKNDWLLSGLESVLHLKLEIIEKNDICKNCTSWLESYKSYH